MIRHSPSTAVLHISYDLGNKRQSILTLPIDDLDIEFDTEISRLRKESVLQNGVQ